MRRTGRAETATAMAAAAGGGKRRAGAARSAELSDDQKAEIREAFDLFDADKTGAISFHELRVCLKAFGFDNVGKKEMQALRRDYDPKHCGKIDFVDFEEILGRRLLDRDPLDEMRKAFSLFDTDSKGKINLKDLRRVARELGETVSDEELQAMIEEFDLNGDDEINEEEFLQIMKQASVID